MEFLTSNGMRTPSLVSSRVDVVDKIITDLRIEEIPAISDVGSDDPAIAIHELDSRSIVLWGIALDRLLRAYHAQFSIHGTTLLDTETLEEFMEIAFDERTQPLTRHILKMTLRGKTVSLAEIAERRYRRDTPHFRKLQQLLKKNILWRMRDLGLWDVVELKGKCSNGSERIAGYAISAGPVLWIFHQKVYLPWRRKQICAMANLLEEVQ